MTLEEVIHETLDITVHKDGKTTAYNLPVVAQAIRQWIKSRLPKEKGIWFDIPQQTYFTYENKGTKLYPSTESIVEMAINQALKDVRQSLGEE